LRFRPRRRPAFKEGRWQRPAPRGLAGRRITCRPPRRTSPRQAAPASDAIQGQSGDAKIIWGGSLGRPGGGGIPSPSCTRDMDPARRLTACEISTAATFLPALGGAPTAGFCGHGKARDLLLLRHSRKKTRERGGWSNVNTRKRFKARRDDFSRLGGFSPRGLSVVGPPFPRPHKIHLTPKKLSSAIGRHHGVRYARTGKMIFSARRNLRARCKACIATQGSRSIRQTSPGGACVLSRCVNFKIEERNDIHDPQNQAGN